MFQEYIDQIKEALKEDSLSHTIDQLTSQDDLNVCFITAYKYDRSEEENEKLNKDLYHDLHDLGYGLSKSIGGYKYKDKPEDEDDKIGHEPGFKVAARNNPEVFKEEMLALGRKYNQEAILLKLPGEEAAYYLSATGEIDTKFNAIKHANPQDKSTFQYGYTQLAKDVKKNPTRAFQYDNVTEESFTLTEDEFKELPSPGAPYYGLTHWTGNGQIMRAICRTNLGLTPYPTNKKD